MKLMAPVVLGQTASMVMQHSPMLAGRQFAMAMCSPSYPGALPVSIPGVSEGVLRLDPLAFSVLGIGVLDASGVSPALSFLVPNDPLLVGASFDVQAADIDGAGLVTLTDNDLEIVVAAPPPASLNLVAIAAGTFQMGSSAVGGSALPVHAVTITRPFWIGKYEVTHAEWTAIMVSNNPLFPGANRPVDVSSWSMGVAYCNLLTLQEAAAGRLPTGYVYRLPTEAEWEYCCRAGTTTEWNVGSTLGCGDAAHNACVPGPGPAGQTSDVGSYAPNAWGLHDMHGNVWEWCLDTWDGSANYPAGAVDDPYSPAPAYPASAPYYIVRGGAFFTPSSFCRSAERNGFGPVLMLGVGFRIVCAPVRD
ncbi:MAG: formylglycine-generating enzyme family protein [Planctomycetota bacterium]